MQQVLHETHTKVEVGDGMAILVVMLWEIGIK